jgi:hypothetical protein
MSVTARRTEPWVLEDSDCMDVIVKRTENGTTTLYASKHYIVQISRTLIGVVGFAEEAGSTRSLFTVYTGGGLTMGYYSSGKQYRCTRDHIATVDLITGEAVQDQIWEYYSEPEEIEFSTFRGAS